MTTIRKYKKYCETFDIKIKCNGAAEFINFYFNDKLVGIIYLPEALDLQKQLEQAIDKSLEDF